MLGGTMDGLDSPNSKCPRLIIKIADYSEEKYWCRIEKGIESIEID